MPCLEYLEAWFTMMAAKEFFTGVPPQLSFEVFTWIDRNYPK